MKYEFRTETIKDFNFYCDTTLTENMTFSEAIDNIEEANNTYYYISLNENDVIEAIKNEIEVASQLDLDLVFIAKLGIYIALQP